MASPNRLCQHRTNIDDVDLVGQLELLVLRDRVRDDHPLHSRIFDDLSEEEQSRRQLTCPRRLDDCRETDVPESPSRSRYRE